MPTKPKIAKKISRPARENCSIETLKGLQVSVADLTARERPEDPREAFATARQWAQSNYFIGGLHHLTNLFFNYGLKLTAADPAQRGAFAAWLAQEDGEPELRAEKYVFSAVAEWLLQDNLVSFWRDSGDYPYPLPCERCTYTNKLGVEILKVRLGLKATDLAGPEFTPIERARYLRGEITVEREQGENYQVLTRGMMCGGGFNYPRMAQVFRTVSQAESMEVGESLLAYAGRTVIRMHHLGWEVRTGNSGLRQTDAMWDAARAAGIENHFKGLQGGLAEATTNFDHKVSTLWTDPKLYDAKKWDSISTRLQWYGGPLAFLLLARTPNPDLLPLFKAQIQHERRLLRLHLERALNRAMRPPGGIRLLWSNRCFTSPKLFWDMTKALVTQGPLSLRTALEAGDFDPETEAVQKQVESQEDPKLHLPLFDPAHGKRPNDPAGRPTGAKTGEGSV